MPLPVAHSLMGYTIGESTRYRLVQNFWVNAIILIVLANLPDIDFLPGFLAGTPNMYHHHETHSLGFAMLIGICSGAGFWLWRRRFWPYFALTFAAVSSHLALDLLTQDFAGPRGMMLLWPLTSEFYDSPWKFFLAVSKSNHSADFLASVFHADNIRVVVMELAIMLPLAAFVTLKRLWLKRAHAPTKAGRRRTVTHRIETTLVWKTRRKTARLAEMESMAAAQALKDEQRDLIKPGYRNGKR
ncbi:MAG: metal-dependent hydrolase [bacterium]